MSVPYIQTFEIPGLSGLGIEDHKDGKSKDLHFFPGPDRSRFCCWSGGCGIGGKPTLKKARKHVYDYAIERLTCHRDRLLKELTEVTVSLDNLKMGPGDLDMFNTGPS